MQFLTAVAVCSHLNDFDFTDGSNGNYYIKCGRCCRWLAHLCSFLRMHGHVWARVLFQVRYRRQVRVKRPALPGMSPYYGHTPMHAPPMWSDTHAWRPRAVQVNPSIPLFGNMRFLSGAGPFVSMWLVFSSLGAVYLVLMNPGHGLWARLLGVGYSISLCVVVVAARCWGLQCVN